jgi:hypothetical protein
MSSALTGGESFGRAEHEARAYLLIDRNYPKKLREFFPFYKLGFTYLPEEISHSGAEATYNDIDIVGRWAPYQVYQSTSAEELSFTLQFFAYRNVFDDVVSKVNFLRSLKYPIVYQGISYRPPKVLFVFGDFLAKMCILKEATPTYRTPWEVLQEDVDVPSKPVHTLLPMVAECSITLGVISDIPVSFNGVLNNDNLGLAAINPKFVASARTKVAELTVGTDFDKFISGGRAA